MSLSVNARATIVKDKEADGKATCRYVEVI